MAIKRTKEASGGSMLPERLESLLYQGFSFQAVSKKYEEIFKSVKGKVVNYLENNDDGFECEMSKGFKCDQGTVIYKIRSNYNYDADKILAMIEDGTLSLATVINMAKFDAKAMKSALGEKKFNDVATNNPTESLTLSGSAEWKATCDEKFSDLSALVPSADPVDVEAELGEDASDSLAKAKAAKSKKKTKGKKKSADDELDSILKG